MKNVLVMSHAGVIHANRAPFIHLAQYVKAKITLVVPTRWKGDLITELTYQAHASDRGIDIIPLPVRFSGRGSFFYYPTLNPSKMDRPDILCLDEEPWSLSAFQAYRAFSATPRKVFFTKQNIFKRLPPPFSFIQNWVLKKTSQAFSISPETSQVLRRKGYTQPILEIPHSFDRTLFHPLSPELRAKRCQDLGIPADAWIVAYCGRMAEEKGIQDLLTAMERLLHGPSSQKYHFLWVGNGPLYSFVKETLQSLPAGRATLLPALPHDRIGEVLAISQVLVLPSRTLPNWKEQFGRILVESMACGVPVIGSDSGEIPNVIRNTGGGLVFPEGDHLKLAEALAKLAQDTTLHHSLSQAGLQSALNHFSHEAAARVWAQGLGLEEK